MYHYTYLITDLVDYSFYVGVRSSDVKPKDDVYLGSGTIIKAKVKKHGKERFYKRILREFATREEADIAEEEHVTLEFLKVPGVLNLRVGGNKGSKPGVSKPFKNSPAQQAAIKRWNEGSVKVNKGRSFTSEHCHASGNSWRGKKRGPQSEEHRAKIKAKAEKRIPTPEHCENLRLAAIKQWERQKAQKAQSEAKKLQEGV